MKASNNQKGTPPYKVYLVDQFQGHTEYGYDEVNCYENLQEAIDVAREITEKGIKDCETIDKWLGMGIAGLVYDSLGALIWDGVSEYKKRNNST